MSHILRPIRSGFSDLWYAFEMGEGAHGERAKKLSQLYPLPLLCHLGEASGLGNPPRELAENLLLFDYLPYTDILDKIDLLFTTQGRYHDGLY